MHAWKGLLAAAAAAVLAVGCTGGQAESRLPPLNTAALADPSIKGARYALDRYLAARTALDYEKVYEVLSPRTQQAYSLEELRGFFRDYLSYRVGGVGEPQQVQDRWVRFPLQRVQWELKGRPATEGELWYVTVHYDGNRWGVALADPLARRADDAVAAGDLNALHQVADQMLAVDPFSFRAHLQKGYAHLYAGRGRESLAQMREAAMVVPPPGASEVYIALGDLHRMADDYAQAADFYLRALESMNRYEGLFDNGQTAALHRAVSISSAAAGDLGAARKAAVAALLQAPFDGRHYALVGSLAAR